MIKEEIENSLKSLNPELTPGEKLLFSGNSPEKILERAERYCFFAEKTGRMFVDADLEKKEIYWEGAIKDITGYDIEEFKKIYLKGFKELLHPEDRKRISRIIDSSLKTGEGINEEYRLRRKNGSYVHLENSVIFLKDEEGRPYRALGIFIDITEKILSRQKLKRIEEKFLYVAEQTGQLILDIDTKTNKIEWAGAIEEITGYSPGELSEVYLPTLRKFIPLEDREKIWGALEHSLDTGNKFCQEFWARKKNGSHMYVETSVIFLKDEKGKVYRALGVMKDITEKKQSQEELQKSEERYRFIAEQTGQIVYDCCIEKDRADFSGSFEELTGHTSEEFNEGSVDFWIEHVHPEDREEAWNIHQKVLETGGICGVEYRFRKKDGSYVYLEDHGVGLKDEKGQICRILGVLKDVTEKKLAEETIKRAEEIRKKEIHHRIKNNLQVISSLLDLQAEKFSNSQEVVEAFRESQNRIISMSMIHEGLYRSRDMKTLDFTGYIQRLAAELFRSYKLENAEVSLQMDLEEDIHLCMDTAIPLGIIINEIISNSLKHAFPAGRKGDVRIKLYKTENPEEKPEENPESCKNSRLTLLISDNGSGLPENIDFDNPDTLGLQLVNTLVNQIEGEIEVVRNEGTEFRIRFGKMDG